MFQYPLNLHCSQTSIGSVSKLYRFQYPLNLHCSQTMYDDFTFLKSFNTLWIYTALKQSHIIKNIIVVSIPSEFTLLSNYIDYVPILFLFQYPLNLHCSQTHASASRLSPKFQYPLNLHCSQTKCTQCSDAFQFQYPLNLHCSQTNRRLRFYEQAFQYPLNLHCSQTNINSSASFSSFNTLWIYTALKQCLILQVQNSVSIPSEFTLLSNIFS